MLALSALGVVACLMLVYRLLRVPATASSGLPAPARPLVYAVSEVPAVAVPAASAAEGGLGAGADFERWMRQSSSLRGAELDGDWSLDASGRLVPSMALRRRFDMLTLLTGEAAPQAIDRFIESSVRSRPGAHADAAAEVLDLWHRFVALQGHRFAHAADPARPATWQAALAEHQRVRREMLGIAAADAFYRDEEAAFALRIDAAMSMPAPASAGAFRARRGADPPALIDPATLDAEARRRLDDEAAFQARWAARLDAARAQVDTLRAAPELSPPQRAAAIDRWLADNFDSAEQRRVRGLLDLPSR